MRKENRQQLQLNTKMSRIWQSFRAVGKEKRAELVDHTFSFHIDDIGTGWEYVHFLLDDDGFGCRISYIGPGVTSFVESMISLNKWESKIFTWYDEPGEYTWLVSRHGEFVYVEPPYEIKGFFLKYDYFCKQIQEGYKNSLYGAD